METIQWREEILGTIARFEDHIQKSVKTSRPFYLIDKLRKYSHTRYLTMSWQYFMQGWGKISSRIRLCPDADVFFKRLWNAIDKSTTRIVISMYTMDGRGVSAITWEKLIAAANRGVKLVCAVDALRHEVTKEMASRLEECGGKFICYNNPLKFISYILQNKRHQILSRHHEKILLIDDKVFIGSGNLKGEYGGPLFGTNLFHDIYVIIKKAPAREILEFMRATVDKGQENQVPRVGSSPYPSDLFKRYKDEDEKFEFRFEAPAVCAEVTARLPKILHSAKSRIILVQPYFQLVPRIIREVLYARRRGVRVIIITARDRDLMVYKYMPNYLLFKPLIDAGCEVYEDMSKYLHMKLYVVDNKHFSLGSFNNDFCSSYCNTEANIFFSTKNKRCPLFDQIDQVVLDLKKVTRPICRPADATFFTDLRDQFQYRFWGVVQRFCNRVIQVFNPDIKREFKQND